MRYILALLLSINLFALDLEPAYKKAIELNKKVLLFVYSDGCHWCEKMKETTLSDKDVKEFIESRYIFIMSDNTTKFDTNFFPTTYIIEPKDKSIIYEMAGFRDSETFMDELYFK